MNLKSSIVAFGVVAAMSCAGALAAAQQTGAQGGGPPAGAAQVRGQQGAAMQGPRAGMRGPAGGGGQMAPAELERWLDAYVLLQAQETLKLTDAQFPRFVQRLKALQEMRRRNLQARRQMLATLAGVMKATPFDESAVRERLKALRDLDVRSAEELQKTRDAVDDVLDVPQQARFRLFEEAVERRKIDLLMRARQVGRRGAPEAPAGIR
jgi:Spy/CpxP family protein refolding chaperone